MTKTARDFLTEIGYDETIHDLRLQENWPSLLKYCRRVDRQLGRRIRACAGRPAQPLVEYQRARWAVLWCISIALRGLNLHAESIRVAEQYVSAVARQPHDAWDMYYALSQLATRCMEASQPERAKSVLHRAMVEGARSGRIGPVIDGLNLLASFERQLGQEDRRAVYEQLARDVETSVELGKHPSTWLRNWKR